ncbi:MAG TPA: helix-turn-helix domain-containing protein [Stellaceae bacterium]|nr:helix-turn-helix domain-containing protein [Stellaceae bacterium]
MNIHALIDRVPGLTPRHVRFLIAEGFVPPPRGGRATASYGEDHVAAILRYQRLREAGLPPAAIRVVMASDGGVPLPVAPGVALLLNPDNLDSALDSAAAADRVREILDAFLKEKNHGDATDRS